METKTIKNIVNTIILALLLSYIFCTEWIKYKNNLLSEKFKNEYKVSKGRIIDVAITRGTWYLVSKFSVQKVDYLGYEPQPGDNSERDTTWIGRKYKVKYLEDDPANYNRICFDQPILDTLEPEKNKQVLEQSK